jgi:hypothetical protein
MSLCTMPYLCRNWIAARICKVILVLSFYMRVVFFLCKRSYNVPSRKYSITIQSVGGMVIAPIRRTILGCLYLESIVNSLLNSVINSSLMLGLNIFFTATSIPQNLPRWIVLNPPIDICYPISTSSALISNTPFLNSAIGSFYFYYICIFLTRSVFLLTFI